MEGQKGCIGHINRMDSRYVDTQNKRGDKKKKPLPIIKYNDYMSGVDRQDQLLSYYPCERKTLRWYKKVGIHILQQLLLNSYLLYCQNERKIPFYNFRLNIIRSLLKKNDKTGELGEKQYEILTKLPTTVPFVHTLQLLPKSEKNDKSSTQTM